MIPFDQLDRPRVLILALAGIGNLLMASPLFRALKDANPTAEIDVLVAPRGTAEVLEGNPRIRRILHGNAKPSLTEGRGLIRELKNARYDVGIVAHPGQLIASSSLLFFGRVRRRLGHRYTWKILHHSGLFLTDPVPLVLHVSLALLDRSAHDLVQNANLVRPLGIAVNPLEARYDFPLTPDDRSRADAWLAERDLANRTLIGFHPGAHHDLAYKRWPGARWSALGDWLSERYGAASLVFGGKGEHALKAEVCARMKTPAVPVDAPLRTTAALIARCTLFVSNDSGLMHVAVSQHVPTFGLFGPTDERRTAPWGPHGHVIRAAGTRPTYNVARLGDIREQHDADRSLQALSVEDVAREISAAVPPQG